MKLNVPADDRPRRELEAAELLQAYGLQWLCLTVQVQAGVSKRTGEVRYRSVSTRYLLRELGGGEFRLVTERQDENGEPVAYTVTRFGCDCMDAQVRGRERTCKHFEALRQLGLIAEAARADPQS